MSDERQAAIGSATVAKVLKDGSIRLIVDIEPRFRDVLASWLEPDMPVAVARITRQAAAGEMQAAATSAPSYGEQARELKLSSFFRTPDVWRAVGTDAAYQAWCRNQVCAACERDGWDQNPIVFAHVRRIANGAGEGIRPPYSGIPLHESEHKLQHQYGESRIAVPETWDRWRIEHLQRWCWESLKTELGFESWRDVPPAKLLAWAQRMHVDHLLPACYREV